MPSARMGRKFLLRPSDLETFTATDGHPFLVLSGERLDLRGDAPLNNVPFRVRMT
jgi:hypothetical protein